MDWAHFAKQNSELYGSGNQFARGRQLRFSSDYQQLSEQSAGANGDIRRKLAASKAWRCRKRIRGIGSLARGFTMEVEMKIRGLMMDPVTNMPIVILKDIGSDTVLPIWVGVYEANAIALEIEKVTTPRPMTHDLIKNVLVGLESQVRKVVVTELRDDTFFAVIWVERDGRIISIDSRPSDALALALRVDCPIFVEDEVLKSSKLAANSSERLTSEELRKWLEGLNDEDMGRYKM